MAGPCPAGRESDRRVTASNIGAHRAKTDSEREMSFSEGTMYRSPESRRGWSWWYLLLVVQLVAGSLATLL